MSNLSTGPKPVSRREQERERRRRKKAWVTESPLDIRAFYRDSLGVQGDEVLDLYTKNTNYVYRNKGEVFIHAGEPVSTVRFVISGVSRSYVLGPEGQDNVICFGYRYGQPVLGASSLSSTTSLFVEAVTDMETLEVPTSVIRQGIQMDFSNASVYERLLAEDHDNQTRIQIVLNTMNGEERYRWFRKDYAEIIDDVPQNYVASFLGLQPQSLSRIKRTLKEQDET
ncbi:MAG: Crp/Fnr family transcriptional regulator [Clostridia bacterium]|nr:Crp/Fnr family transcriptional regulator [Clostridia bacterium]MBQ8925927.1 Crp/Fnr family transcriptional regulator [Clostridia bacterium]